MHTVDVVWNDKRKIDQRVKIRQRLNVCTLGWIKPCGLKRDCWQSFGPTQVSLGDCAAIKIGGVEVVLIANRTQALGLELFRNVGIEPLERKMLVVKSTNHFMGSFGPIAKKVIYIDSDGPIPRDHSKVPYARINRPVWPLDANTSPGLIV